jgi:iron complex outermembrane receptor protein
MTVNTMKGALAIGTALSLSFATSAIAREAGPSGDQAANAAPTSPKPAPALRGAEGEDHDIVVTARRIEERLQDVPISITVFNQQQLANRNIVTAGELASYTPSLSVNPNFGTDNTSFAIRGFVQDVGTAPSVGVYFADVVALRGPTQGTTAGDGAGPGSFFDLQNVQVLKGPQGTLFGRNTTGGAILFVPQKPTSKLEGYIEGSIGNYGLKRIQGALNIPLSNIARFRIAVDHESRDGYLKNDSGIGPKDFDNINYTTVRASLVVDLTPDLENYTIVSYTNSDNNGSVQKVIACNPSASPTNFLGQLTCAQIAREQAKGAGFYTVESSIPERAYSKIEQWHIINTTTWHASDSLTVKNIASYGQFKDRQVSPLFGNDWSLNFPPFNITTPFYLTEIAPSDNLAAANQNTFTNEFQLQGTSLNGKLSYQAGLYFEGSDPLSNTGFNGEQLVLCQDRKTLTGCFAPLGTGGVNLATGETSFRDEGVYSQASYALTDKLKLTAGARYTWDHQTSDSTHISYIFPVPFGPAESFCTDATTAPSCKDRIKERSHKPTWLIDLDYKPMDDILVYGKYARGYRTGGVTANAPTNYRTYQPEKVDTYEIGAKTSFRGAVHGTFDVAGFYNNFTNQQLQVGFDTAPGATVAQTTGVVNAGRSRMYGAEAEATLTPFNGLTIDAAYTYLNAKIKKIQPLVSSDPNYVVFNQIFAGNSLVLSPKNKATVTVNYTLPLAERIGRVSIGVTFTHTDKQLTTYAYNSAPLLAAYGSNLGLIAATNLLNLNLNWNSVANHPVDLSLFATNVTQKKYYAFVAGLGQSGFESAVLGEPRMFGARLRYRFGQ